MIPLCISIDFDGTIVESNYPTIIGLKPDAARCINQLYSDGHTIIINTCRVKEHLENAVKYLNESGIKYHYVNENDPSRIAKFLDDTRKISADVYIDDKNIFCREISWSDIVQEIDRLSNIQIFENSEFVKISSE